MLRKKWQKVLLTIFALLLLGGVATWAWIKHDRSQRTIAAEAKWLRIKQEAASMGVHTNLDAYLEKESGLYPRLFDDFPFVNKILSQSLDGDFEESSFDFDELAGLKELPSLTKEITHSQRADTLKKTLTLELPDDAGDNEVYLATLSALEPWDEELEQWKSAITQAKGLSKDFYKDHLFFVPASPLRNLSQVLLLRSYCNWMLQSEDTSDIDTVIKLSKLLSNRTPSFISLSVSIAIDLLICDTLIATIQSPSISHEFTKKLLHKFPTLDAKTVFKKGLQTEYVFQIHQINNLEELAIPSFSYGEGSFFEYKIEIPKYAKSEMMADHVEFNLAYYFGMHAIFSDYVNDSSSERARSLLSSYEYPPHSHELLSILGVGINYYFDNALKTSMLLDSTYLQAACVAYRKEYGAYPQSLSDLSPKYLPSIPRTPLTNAEYQYHWNKQLESLPSIKATIPIESRDDISIP